MMNPHAHLTFDLIIKNERQKKRRKGGKKVVDSVIVP